MADEVNFGTAWVEVHAKLDDYERELAQAEQSTRETIIRVRQEAGQGGGGGGGLFSAGDAVIGYSLGRNMGRIRRMIGLTQRLLTVARSAGAAIARWAAPVLIITELGNIVRLIESIPSAARAAADWLRGLTVRGLLDGLLQVDITIGNVIGKIPILGQGLRETANQLRRAFGFGDTIRETEALEKALEKAENRMDALGRAARFPRESGLKDTAEQARRSGVLGGLDGSNRIRAEGAFDIADAQRQGREAAGALFEAYNREITQLREENAAGLIDDQQLAEQIEVLTQERIRLMGRQEEQAADAIEQIRRATTARVARADQAAAVAGAMRIQQVQRRLMIERADLELEGADAQAEQIRLGYQFQILDAVRDGEHERAALLEQLARVRIAQVRRNELEAWEAWVEAQEQGATRARDSVRDAYTELARVQLELSSPEAGRNRLLEGFDINAAADRESQGIKRQIQELREAQDEYRRSQPYGLVSDEQFETYNAYAKQIEALEQLLGLTEQLRQKRQQLADQRDAERRAGFGQIDVRDIVAGSLVRAGDGEGGENGRESIRVQTGSYQELIAIRQLIQDGATGSTFQ